MLKSNFLHFGAKIFFNEKEKRARTENYGLSALPDVEMPTFSAVRCGFLRW